MLGARLRRWRRGRWIGSALRRRGGCVGSGDADAVGGAVGGAAGVGVGAARRAAMSCSKKNAYDASGEFVVHDRLVVFSDDVDSEFLYLVLG